VKPFPTFRASWRSWHNLKRMSRDLVVMAISLFTWGLGEGMFFYFQSLYLEQWGADPLQIGAILGGMGVAMAVAQAPAGWLGDRIGSRPVMWSSWILGALAAGVMALAGSLTMFVTGMLLYGLTSFVIGPMNAYITSVRGSWSVQRALTFVGSVYHFGAVIGPFVGGMLASRYGLKSIFSVSAAIFVLSTLIVLTARKPPLEIHSQIHSKRPGLLKNSRFAGILVLIVFTMFALYLGQPLSANYLKNIHQLSFEQIGLLGSANSLGNAILLMALGFLHAPAGFLVGQLLVGLFSLLMWQGSHLAWFGLAYFFLGGYRLARAMILAHARSMVRPGETGLAYGLVETANAIAIIIAPPVAGLLYASSPRLVYSVSFALIAVMIVINLVFLLRRRAATSGDAPATQPAHPSLREPETTE
jgi:MFS transporter, DHA1 family, multidrug resistance protein